MEIDSVHQRAGHFRWLIYTTPCNASENLIELKILFLKKHQTGIPDKYWHGRQQKTATII